MKKHRLVPLTRLGPTVCRCNWFWLVLAGAALAPTAPGAPNSGLSFNGASAYVETSTGVIPGSGDFTVEFWAACPSAPSAYKEILSQGASGDALYVGTDTANNIRLGDGWGAVSPGVEFPVGGWHHFALVKSSTNAVFYLDAVVQATRGPGMPNPAASTGLRFGRQYDDNGEYWPGSIGDVRVWSKALSGAEISAGLAGQLTGAEANLVANWQFREGAGVTCTALGPVSVVGMLINGPVWIVPPVFSLGSTNYTEGPSAGSDSVALAVSPAGAAWTAAANAAWLQVATASGNGRTNVVFTFDANPGATRTGTLTVAGQTVTVTQAGAAYVPAAVTTLAEGFDAPRGVAVDKAGNVYVADSENLAIKKWSVANQGVTLLFSTGANRPDGVAVDGAGNVYLADRLNGSSAQSEIRAWNAASNTLTTLASDKIVPSGVAVDGAGNVYFPDVVSFGPYQVNVLKEWNAASNTVTMLLTNGLRSPSGVALDKAGNVYIADTLDNAVKEWNVANRRLTTPVSGLYRPYGVAVDGAGNIYIADTMNNAVKVWNAAGNSVTTLASGLSQPFGVAVDGAGNVFIADTGNNAIKTLPRAFLNPAALSEGPGAGSDSLPPVLPATQNLSGLFAPASDQSWLIIAGTANGVVSFSFAANPSAASRTANITLLGQTIPVTQAGLPALANAAFNGSRQFRFQFAGATNCSYTVFGTTNLALPLSAWLPLNEVIQSSPGQFVFTDTNAPAGPQRFYRLRSP